MLIKKLTIKVFRWAISPYRIKKVKDTASFHKSCEYHQSDIQRLFDDGFFEFSNGSMEYYRDKYGNLRGQPKLVKYV